MEENMYVLGDQRVARDEHKEKGYHHCPGCGAVVVSRYVYCDSCSYLSKNSYLTIDDELEVSR